MKRSSHSVSVMFLAATLGVCNASVITIDATSFTGGLNSQVIGGLLWTSSPGNFQHKSQGGFTGVGISGGRTAGEIDIGEYLTATILPGNSPFWVSSLTVALLFDGPEYGDVQETAQIRITRLSGPDLYFTLVNTYQSSGPDLAVWNGFGTVTNLAASVNGGGAVWRIDNPFGTISDITSIQWTALNGSCAPGLNCNNQSDFTFVRLQYQPVPEPSTLLLMSAGLGLLGVSNRRRAKRASG